MSASSSRRGFLTRSLSAGALISLGDLGFLKQLPLRLGRRRRREIRRSSAPLRCRAPRQTDRRHTPKSPPGSRCLEKINGGTSYREILAALQLVSVLNVEPRPSVGFKFHTVLSVNSCHLASLSSPPEHRWLPIFWALDNYKGAAQRDVQERGDWRMAAVDESAVPAPHNAIEAFEAAMSKWDVAAADAAVTSLARSAGANEVYEMFFRLGARATSAPSGTRRSSSPTVFAHSSASAGSTPNPSSVRWPIALTMYDGGNPAESDHEADRPYRINSRRVSEIRADWRNGKIDAAATREMLETLRTADYDEASAKVVELINKGAAPQSPLGCVPGRFRRTGNAPTGDHWPARLDDDECDGLCFPHGRQR